MRFSKVHPLGMAWLAISRSLPVAAVLLSTVLLFACGARSASAQTATLPSPYLKTGQLPLQSVFASGLVEARNGFSYGLGYVYDNDPMIPGYTAIFYRVDKKGQAQVLHRLTRMEGLTPHTLLAADDGCLYGSTSQGGENGKGTIFRFDPSTGIFSKITDSPAEMSLGNLCCIGPDGALYGTSFNLVSRDRGLIFRCSRQGEITVIRVLTDADIPAAGDSPLSIAPLSFLGGLIGGSDGNLYGIAYGGPVFQRKLGLFLEPVDYGVLFKCTLDGNLAVIAEFDPSQGHPASIVEGADGFIYTLSNADAFEDGSVFYYTHLLRISKNGGVTILHTYDRWQPLSTNEYLDTVILGRNGDIFALVGFPDHCTLYRDNLESDPTQVTSVLDFPSDRAPNIPGALSLGTDGYLRGVMEGQTGTKVTNGIYASQLYSGEVNLPPVARDDSVMRPSATSASGVVINVLANDSDKNHDPLEVASITQPGHGTATIEDGAKRIRYVSDSSDTIFDSFTYTISDGQGGTATASVYLYNKAATGFYSGLLPVADGSGFLQIQTTHGSTLTGVLFIEGTRFTLRGIMDANGSFAFSQYAVLADVNAPVTLHLQRSTDGREITGSVSYGAASYDFTLPQVPNYTPQAAGKYTIALPRNSRLPAVYGGNGCGTLQVGTHGTVTTVGRLADGKAFSAGGRIDSHNDLQLFARLYVIGTTTFHTSEPASGWLSGVVQFRDTTNDDCTGQLSWLRPRISIFGVIPPPPFSVQQPLVGSRWSIPIGSVSATGLAGGTIKFDAGLTGPQYSTAASPSTDDLTIFGDAYNISVQENFSSGLFFGTLSHPVFGNSKCSGVILQKRNIGFGQCYRTSDRTGLFELTTQ